MAQLSRSLDDARAHTSSVWTDTPPINPDGTVTGYVEIGRGDRRKWEFRIARNVREIDRVMPAAVGA